MEAGPSLSAVSQEDLYKQKLWVSIMGFVTVTPVTTHLSTSLFGFQTQC